MYDDRWASIQVTLYHQQAVDQTPEPQYRYPRVGHMVVWHPPAVGDLVTGDGGKLWEVTRRCWTHPQPGSFTAQEGGPPMLDLLVRRGQGLFQNEVEEDDDARS